MANLYIKGEFFESDDDLDVKQTESTQNEDLFDPFDSIRALIFPKTSYRCNMCPQTFGSTQDLAVHIKEAHSDDVLSEYLKLVIAQQEPHRLASKPLAPPNPILRQTGRRGHPCWRFFHRIDRFDAMCLLCSIRVRSACSTNLTRHLARHHPNEAIHVRRTQIEKKNQLRYPMSTASNQAIIDFILRQPQLRLDEERIDKPTCPSKRTRQTSETVCPQRSEGGGEGERAASAPPPTTIHHHLHPLEGSMDGDTSNLPAARPVALRPLVSSIPLSSAPTWCSSLPASVSAAYQELRPAATHSYDLFVDHLQQQKYETSLPKYDYSLSAYDSVSKVFTDESVILKTDDVKSFEAHPHIHSVVVAPMATIAEFTHPSLCASSFSSNLSNTSSDLSTITQSQLVQQLEQQQLHGQLNLGVELTREQLLQNSQQLQHTLTQQQHHQIQLQAPSVIETRKSVEASTKGDGAAPAKRGRPTENPCWNYFIRLDDQNVRCRICSKVVKSACATNMTKHLERHHQNDYQHLIVQIKQYRQQKVPQAVLPLSSGHQGCILPTPGHFIKSESPYVHDIYSQQFDCHDALLRNYVSVDTTGNQVVWPRSSTSARTWSSFDGSSWNSLEPTTSASMSDAWSQSLVPNDPTHPLTAHDKPYLKRNRKTEHPVWEFFKRTADGNAQCAICGGVVKSPCSSNFMRHLMRHHAAEYNAVYVKWVQKRAPMK